MAPSENRDSGRMTGYSENYASEVQNHVFLTRLELKHYKIRISNF